MRHDSGQFRLFVSREYDARVHEDEPAREGKGVDAVVFDHLERERHLGVGVPDDILPDAVDELVDDRVLDEPDLTLHLGGQLASERDLFLERREVQVTQSLVDVAVPDVVDIGVLGLLLFRRDHRVGRDDHQNHRHRNPGKLIEHVKFSGKLCYSILSTGPSGCQGNWTIHKPFWKKPFHRKDKSIPGWV